MWMGAADRLGGDETLVGVRWRHLDIDHPQRQEDSCPLAPVDRARCRLADHLDAFLFEEVDDSLASGACHPRLRHRGISAFTRASNEQSTAECTDASAESDADIGLPGATVCAADDENAVALGNVDGSTSRRVRNVANHHFDEQARRSRRWAPEVHLTELDWNSALSTNNRTAIRPWLRRDGGKMPWARSRSSVSASWACSDADEISVARSSSPFGAAVRCARRSSNVAARSRCWAPS
jgi:hypothetical protein